MEKETECPCTISCPLRGDCIKCYGHETSVKALPYCMDPAVSVSKTIEERVRAGLLAAGVPLLGDGMQGE